MLILYLKFSLTIQENIKSNTDRNIFNKILKPLFNINESNVNK